MRNPLPPFVILLAILLFFCQSDKSSDLEVHIPELQTIDKIFIAYRSGETILLQKTGQTWWVNSSYKARPDAIKNLLQTLHLQRIKNIPPHAVADLIIKDISVFGAKVEIYSGDNQLKVLYVGGVTADELGTHVMLEGNDQPYVMHIPGFQGSLRSRFVMPVDEWRDLSLLPFSRDSLIKMEVKYPQKKLVSFTLTKNNQHWQVSSEERYAQYERPPNDKLIQAYLTELFSVSLEAFDNSNSIKHNISSSILPFCEMIYTLKGNKEFSLRIFTDPADAQKTGQLFIFTSENDFCVAQERVLGKIFTGYDYFYH